MSEAMEEIQRLTNEVERLQAVDADREKYFALLKEREVELNRQLDRTTEARDRFRDSLYRLADIVGLTGNRCFSPEAVERQAKYELTTLRGRVQDLEGRRFPIQGGPSIPWSMIGPHDRQCRENHERQSLVDMRRRGGLSPSEALAVLDDESWFKSEWGNFTNDEAKRKAARDELERRRAAFEDETNELRDWKESQLKVEATWALAKRGREDFRRRAAPIQEREGRGRAAEEGRRRMRPSDFRLPRRDAQRGRPTRSRGGVHRDRARNRLRRGRR